MAIECEQLRICIQQMEQEKTRRDQGITTMIGNPIDASITRSSFQEGIRIIEADGIIDIPSVAETPSGDNN